MDGWTTRRALLATTSSVFAITAAGCSNHDPTTATETRPEAPIFAENAVDARTTDADCTIGTPDGYIEFRYRGGPAVDTDRLFLTVDAPDETTHQLADCSGVGSEIVEGEAVIVGAPRGARLKLVWVADSDETAVLSEALVRGTTADEAPASSDVDS